MSEKLYLITSRGTLNGESGECCGSNYYLENVCKTCGTGAKLIGNLIVKKVKEHKAFVETLDGDYLLSEDLYHNFILQNVKIGELQPVLGFKTKKALSYLHFKSNFYFKLH